VPMMCQFEDGRKFENKKQAVMVIIMLRSKL